MTMRLAAGLLRQAAALHMIEVNRLGRGEQKDAGLKPLALHRHGREDEADGEQVAKHVCPAQYAVPLREKQRALFFADEIAAAAGAHARGVGGSGGDVTTLSNDICAGFAIHG